MTSPPPYAGKITYTKTPVDSEAPQLKYPSFQAMALQPVVYGCATKEDVQKNIDNLCQLIDATAFDPVGLGAPKLIVIPEGSIQGFWDEQSNMSQKDYCDNVAITIPGREVEQLAQKAKQYGAYIVAQAKIKEDAIVADRFFNTAFIISPEGEIVLRHVKNVVHVCEGSTTPYDIWDIWSQKVGTDLADHYPVLKTELGNIGVAICYESVFPETYRALASLGAEIFIKMAIPGPLVMDGIWEATNIATAFYNSAYVIAPNFGPYYATTKTNHPFDMGYGHSMIVDFGGRVIRQIKSGNGAAVPAQIEIAKLREFKRSGLTFTVQMRSELWKKIYERWPDYPKNAYLSADISSMEERIRFKQQEPVARHLRSKAIEVAT